MRRDDRPTDAVIDAIYQRLLAGEPDAPSDLIALLLDPLIAALRRRYPSLPDHTWVEEVVIDSLFKFVQDPSHYQPERGKLWSYLYQDANGDLLNLIKKVRRREQRLVVLDPVALAAISGNNNVEVEVLEHLAPTSFAEERDVAAIYTRLREELSDPRDWRCIELMHAGERKTEAFATVLNIAHLPIDEQRKQVKQVKDRLRVRLKRFGVKLQ